MYLLRSGKHQDGKHVVFVVVSAFFLTHAARTFWYDDCSMHTVSGTEIERFEEILPRLPQSVDRALARTVFTDVSEAYGDRVHWSGTNLLRHSLDLLSELTAFHPDTDSVVTCLLHHIPELHLWSFDDIERRYGPVVRTMVGEAHVLSHLTTHNRRVPLERLRLNMFRVTHDARVLLLTLCDALLTLHVAKHLPPEEQRRLCSDAINLYSPVAGRLGVYWLKHELEDAAFPILYPVDHERISEQLEALHAKHGNFLSRAADAVAAELREQGMESIVEGREKLPYSIFLKMRHKTITHIEDIPDLFALRVVVKDEGACYQTLGLLHRMGHPVQNRFKDYIAFPKPNGYQSLHTTLVGLPGVPEGLMTEVQIRTPNMHSEARIGVAAHWSYKEAGVSSDERSRQLVARAMLAKAPMEGIGRAGVSDHIFVLTPRGDVIELPEGATPLDFAFHVHTAVGLSFKAARVNGSIVPLDHALENGDIVEIVRGRDPRPSPRWISLLKTASARNRLKRYLSEERRPQFIADGKDMLNQELRRLRFSPLDAQMTALQSLDGAPQSLIEREDLLVQLGQGAVSLASLLPRLDQLGLRSEDILQPVMPVGIVRIARLEGSIPMPVRYARCCRPEEDEKAMPIVGVIGRSGEVRIHRRSCKMLRTVNPERRIHANWVDPATLKRGARR